ncbi:DUF494 domain-containing protein [Ottowia sp.]|uniref:DUF494 family protein n=1 Tax=Ottowia sp. TaxID=1898956 RepID=UPI002CB891F4|nr:DUF494 domain-containing protein [Ottowia sp.]HOB67498.1 DUF494 domain-containing protein [Ottowia sp.]HPZ58546.1 DUF494 domain-containing protein [Ottowia sp.]HQD48262.1 DUF494 domain-containing protein [Ottowia sp.]
MYEVLVYVYENYGGGGDCPDRHRLGRRLSNAGFERGDILQALQWLDGLDCAADGICVASRPDAPPASWPAAPGSLRVYSPREIEYLGANCIACLMFLENAGALAPELRELVIERALAASDEPLALDDLKIIVMMVYWRMGASLDALVLDELCDDAGRRVAH